jgi:hypothetical protein
VTGRNSNSGHNQGVWARNLNASGHYTRWIPRHICTKMLPNAILRKKKKKKKKNTLCPHFAETCVILPRTPQAPQTACCLGRANAHDRIRRPGMRFWHMCSKLSQQPPHALRISATMYVSRRTFAPGLHCTAITKHQTCIIMCRG